MQLYFRSQGDGFPLIVAHGFLGSSDNWRAASARLAAHYRVYSLDLRNHGASRHSYKMNYRLMAGDVLQFLEEHGIGSCYVLGHSMGGKVAMQFAAEFPARVEKLVVVDIAPRGYAPFHRSILSAMRGLPLGTLASFKDADRALSDAVPDPRIRQFLLKNLARDAGGAMRWKVDLEAMDRNYDSLAGPIFCEQPFDKPACFIRGGRSHYIQDHDLPSIRECFPSAEIHTVEGAGHWIHVEAPEAFLSLVTAFLGTARPHS
jgi:pimeloyl-ACP methyl ester carboxylesterase